MPREVLDGVLAQPPGDVRRCGDNARVSRACPGVVSIHVIDQDNKRLTPFSQAVRSLVIVVSQ